MPPWMGGGGQHKKQGLQLEACSARARTEEEIGRRVLRAILEQSRVSSVNFCSVEIRAQRFGISWDPVARRHAGLRKGIRTWEGGWGSLTWSTWPGMEGGDEAHDERPEEQDRPEPRPSQAPKPNWTPPTWWSVTPVWITKEFNNIFKATRLRVTCSHSLFGNAEESNSQRYECNPSITSISSIFGFTYTATIKEFEKHGGRVTWEGLGGGKEKGEWGNHIIIFKNV